MYAPTILKLAPVLEVDGMFMVGYLHLGPTGRCIRYRGTGTRRECERKPFGRSQLTQRLLLRELLVPLQPVKAAHHYATEDHIVLALLGSDQCNLCGLEIGP